MDKKRVSLESQRAQIGAGLLEVMLAVLVFSISALGAIAIQLSALTQIEDARQTALAIDKANEFLALIASSRSIEHSAETLAAYVAAVGNSDLAKTLDAPAPAALCAAPPPPPCQNGSSTVGTCSVKQRARLDVWTTFCDPIYGIYPYSRPNPPELASLDNKLRGFGVALIPAERGLKLYIRWQTRSSRSPVYRNGERKISVDLCGEIVEVDPKLGVHCARFI